jgi:hypothetical protein
VYLAGSLGWTLQQKGRCLFLWFAWNIKYTYLTLGILLVELYCGGKPPFDLSTWKSPLEFIERVRNRSITPQIPTDLLRCPENISKLMRDCTSFEVSERPDFGEIVEELR